jgi:signal transduction histidine kinase
MVRHTMWKSLIDILPRGNNLDEADWQRRHRLLQWVLVAHVPVLAVIGVVLHNPLLPLTLALAIPLLCAGAGRLLRHHRRLGSGFVSAGLVWCSTALVGITNGTIESHFHFFIIIGFIALYQDWVPFLLNVLFTVLTHGVGSMWLRTLMFNHPAAQEHPWLWSLIHGVAVLLACVGVMLFWRVTEDEQIQKDDLTRKLADGEIARRRFTSDLLVNLARRNQTMLYRQLEIINQLEESESNPDALAELFRLDHLTTRVRRNAENLLVLSGEKPPRVWSQPVPLRDVVRAAIAETEDLDRVLFEIPEGPLVDGASVTDLTHLLAELTENAVRFSPPDMAVTIRCRRDPRGGQGQLLTVEDWGVGMEEPELAATNALLSAAPEIDLSVSKRLGFHVVARLAARHGIRVKLSPTPGSGITASVALPGSLFELSHEPVGALPAVPATASRPGRPAPRRAHTPSSSPRPSRPSPTARVASGSAAVRPFTDRTPADRVPLDGAPTDRAQADRAEADRAEADRAEADRAEADRAPAGHPHTITTRIPVGPAAGAVAREQQAPEQQQEKKAPEQNATPVSLTAGPDAHDPGATPAEARTAATDTTRADTAPEDGDAADRDGEAPRDDAGVRPGIPLPRLPLPAETVPSQPRRSGSWEGWWDGQAGSAEGPDGGATDREVPAPAALTGMPAEAPAPRTDTPVRPMAAVADPPATSGPGGPRLRRRVPQAHLAPGLRVIPPQPDADTAPPPTAADALSRYQASRAAARSTVEGDSSRERTSR